MKTCRICRRDFEPLALPPSPLKTLLDLPDPWEEICPSCGIKLVSDIAAFGLAIIGVLREQIKREKG